VTRTEAFPRADAMSVSIIVPFHRNLDFLERCLGAVTPLPHGWELIIAGDAPVDDCRLLADRFKARLLNLSGPRGPAVARNHAAEAARGEILVFVDADVVASKGAVARAAKILQSEPDTFAVFGAYDEAPDDPGFISQYKNLAHSFIHQSSATIAQTFWAGFGAVRRNAFLSVGGFDERFPRPSVEDIDLGYRLTAAGFRVKLDPSLRACHLKRWTLVGMIVSDIRDRGIPWTQLILRFGRFNSDLNLKSTYRACVVLSYLLLLLVGLAFLDARFLWPVPVLATSLVLLSPRYYRYFYRRRGLWFVIRVFPVHYLYHLYNGFSFAVGSALYSLNRAGVRLPGALPLEPWSGVKARVISDSVKARNVVGVSPLTRAPSANRRQEHT
jgi:glycosyltransferase involved in cell wall biosynthesis